MGHEATTADERRAEQKKKRLKECRKTAFQSSVMLAYQFTKLNGEVRS